MTSIKKTLLSAIIALMTVCSLLFGITFINSNVTARADEELTAADFAVSIAVRVKDDEHPNGGIRFKVRVEKSKFETLMTGGVLNEGVQTGVLVTSNAIAKTLEGGLIKDNAKEEANGVYDLDTTKYWKAIKENEVDYYESVVAIYNVPTDKSNVKLAVMPYVVNGETTVYRNAAGVASMADAVLADTENGAAFAETYIHNYTITYYDQDGNAITDNEDKPITETVRYGNTIAEAKVTAPEVTGYTFDAWKNEAGTTAWVFGENGTKVTGDTNLYAKYTINTYVVTFDTNGGNEIAAASVPYGTASSALDEIIPTKTGYTFVKWQLQTGEDTYVDLDGTETVTENITVKAVWEINVYTVTWKNGETTLETDTEVAYGTTPEYNGATPTKESTAQYTYTFKGWDKEVVAVCDTVTYTAVYESVVNKYTITFLNDDGTQLQATEVEYGTVPTCATTPTKEATAQYTYTFKGWDKDVVAVIGAEIYTAVYESVVNKYTITFNVDGTETTQEVAYGEVPVFNGSTDKVGDAQYIYIFNDWQPALAAVTGETSYTASYYTLDAVNRTFEEGKAYGFEAVAEVNDAVVVKYTDEGLVEPENGAEYCVKFALAGSGPDIALVGNNLTSGTVTFDIYLAYDVEDERASYHMTHSSGEEYGYGVDPDIIGVSGVTAIWTNVWNTFTMDVITAGSCVFTIKLPMNDAADYDLYTIYIDNVKVSVESTEGFDYANRTFEDGKAYGFSIVSSAEKGVAIKYTDEGLAVPLNGGEYCTKFVLSGAEPEIAFIGDNLTVGSTVTFQIYFAYDTAAEGADYKMTHPSGKEYGYGVDPNLYGVDGENAIWTNVWNTFTITVTNEGSVSFKIAIPQPDWNDYGLYTIYIDNIVVNEA